MTYEVKELRTRPYEKSVWCVMENNTIIAECEKEHNARLIVNSMNIANKLIDKLQL